MPALATAVQAMIPQSKASMMNACRMTSPFQHMNSRPPGVRVCASGLDTLSEDGLVGDDRYLIQLWSGTGELKLHKAWEES